mgnify:CR=1 FL=1
MRCVLPPPGLSALEVTERITRSDLPTKVIIVSVLEDGPLPKRLIEAGACGYLGKAGDAAELLRAVRDVARGKRYLGSNVAQNMALSHVAGSGGASTSFRRVNWRWRCCWCKACARKTLPSA